MIQSHYCSIITLTFTKEMTVMIMNKTKCDVLKMKKSMLKLVLS